MKITRTAVLFAAAALLTVCAAFTSMAATYEWYQADEIWRCRDKNGDDIIDEWVKSGSDLFRMNSRGEMVVSQLIDDGGDIYYAGEDGRIVKNDWRRLENEGYPEEISDEYSWYYFTASGKAQKARSNGKPVTISGRKYFFSDEGRMLSGWINDDGSQCEEDYPYREAVYYCGGEDDGMVRQGWSRIEVEDPDSEDGFEMQYWFCFGQDGRKYAASTEEVLKERKINGGMYAFDQYGVMRAEWQPVASTLPESSSEIGSYYWFRDKETGAKLKKGWFRVTPAALVNETDYNDETPHWYYASGRGKLAESCIKTIRGKRYAFNEKGEMLSGLVCLVTDQDKKILAYDVIDTEEELEKVKNGTYGSGNLLTEAGELDLDSMGGAEACFYYLGKEETDGSMKTGVVYINLEGLKYTFYFENKGTLKYRALTGMVGKYYYNNGIRVCADKDLKYQVFKAWDTSGEYPEKITPATKCEYISMPQGGSGEPVTWNQLKNDPTQGGEWMYSYILISKDGTVIKSGIKKDADGNKYKVTNYSVEAID